MTGVGHETDITIADLVADLRVPTPTAAAMQALPDREALARLVDRDLGRLEVAMRGRATAQGLHLTRLHEVLRARSPQARVALARTRADKAMTAAIEAISRQIDQLRRRLAESAAGIHALSPLAVLGRGYALARREADGAIVRSAAELEIGERLDLRLAHGRVIAEVSEVEADDDSV